MEEAESAPGEYATSVNHNHQIEISERPTYIWVLLFFIDVWLPSFDK